MNRTGARKADLPIPLPDDIHKAYNKLKKMTEALSFGRYTEISYGPHMISIGVHNKNTVWLNYHSGKDWTVTLPRICFITSHNIYSYEEVIGHLIRTEEAIRPAKLDLSAGLLPNVDCLLHLDDLSAEIKKAIDGIEIIGCSFTNSFMGSITLNIYECRHWLIFRYGRGWYLQNVQKWEDEKKVTKLSDVGAKPLQPQHF